MYQGEYIDITWQENEILIESVDELDTLLCNILNNRKFPFSEIPNTGIDIANIYLTMYYILAKYGKDHLTPFIHLYQLIYQSISVSMVLRLSESAINRYLTHQLTITHKVASVYSLEYWRNMCWFEIDRFIIQTNRYQCRNINYFSLNLTDNNIGDGRIDAKTRNAISTLQALILFYRFTEIS